MITQANWIRETTTKTGTGVTYPCGSAPSGFKRFSTLGNGAIVLVRVAQNADASGANKECFIGTYTTSGDKITRTAFLSSTTGAPINWPSGTKDMAIVPVAERKPRGTPGRLTVTDDETTGEWVLDVDPDVVGALFEPGVGVEIEDNGDGTFAIHRLRTIYDDTDAATITLDLAADVGEAHRVTIAGNREIAVDNARVGLSFELEVTQGGDGGYACTFLFPIHWVEGFQPEQTPVAGKSDLFHFRIDSVDVYGVPTCTAWVETTERPQPDSGSLGDSTITATVLEIQAGSGGTDLSDNNTAFWKLNETTAGATRVASVGAVNLSASATLAGTTGLLGNAANFATDDSLTGAHNAALQPAAATAYNFSVACWVKLTGSDDYISIHKLPSVSGTTTWQLNIGWQFGPGFSNGGVAFASRFRTGSSIHSKNHSTTLTADGNWHLIVGVIDAVNRKVKVSVDGGAFEESSVAGADIGLADTGGAMKVVTDSAHLGGLVDELGLWQRTLSSADVTALYNSGAGLTTPFSGGTNEIQRVSLDKDAVSGTYTLTLDGQTSAAIDFDEPAAGIKSALEALSNIDEVEVTGGPLNSADVDIEFQGSEAGTNVSLLVCDDASLTAGVAINWSECDTFTATLEAGSGDHVIAHTAIIPGKRLQVIVDNTAGATGTLTWGGEASVDWGSAGAPDLPSTGETIHLEFFAVSTSEVTGRRWFADPVDVGTRSSAAIGTAYQPSTTRDTLVCVSVEISSGASGDGKIELLCDSANPPTTVRATFRVGTAMTIVAGQLCCVVPAGHRWKLASTTASGTPTYSIIGDVQEVGL